MSGRRDRQPGDDHDLEGLLHNWDDVQPTERQTRRLLRTLEVRWSEEQTRHARFHQQDLLFGVGLLLFVAVGSSVVWSRPAQGMGDWLFLAAALAGLVLVLLLPGLMRFDDTRRSGQD